MKFDLRGHWKWLALIAIVVAAALWLRPIDAPAATTLHLGQEEALAVYDELPPLIKQIWVPIDVCSDRLLGIVSTNYSIEARTPKGETNYDLPFFGAGSSAFQTLGTSILPMGQMPMPVRVIVPNDTDEFRVKLSIEEYGAFYSRTIRRASQWSAHGNRYGQMACDLLLRMQQKGVPTTVWSPWMVRSNNVWMEKAER